jgi:hypothetical protein
MSADTTLVRGSCSENRVSEGRRGLIYLLRNRDRDTGSELWALEAG